MYNVSFSKNLIGISMSLLLIVVISFFLSNILTFKDNVKHKFWRVFIIIFISYLITKINKYTYEYRSIIVMIGYIVAIFTQSKDKMLKKILMFIIVFAPNLILNYIITSITAIKNGYTVAEMETLISTTEGYYKYMNVISSGYSYFALNGIFDILYTFIMIAILLIKNRKNYRGVEIYLITFLITGLSTLSGILAYFYLNDILAMIVLLIISISTVLIIIYAYNKLNLYKEYFEQKAEIKFLKEKEELEYNYYKNLLVKEEEIHKIRHDLKNDIQTITSLNDKSKAEKIYDKINKKIDNSSIIKYIDNKLLNMLFNLKREEALENKIDFVIDVTIKDVVLEDIDLINLFSNIIDNALHSSDKKITLTIRNKMGNIFINCKNDISHIKEIHGSGYGLKIINDIVNKYNGTVKVDNKKNIYEISILIPNE